MTVQEWIDRVDRLRRSDDLLTEGQWHGYLNEGSGPMQGRYLLVRWERPTICVSDDDPERVIELARTMERTL